MSIVSRSAELSPCGKYRYLLTRTLADGAGTCVFVMLNPSTADHTVDDQTIRQCIGFAGAWRFRRVEVVNLFAWRATLPRDMLAAIDPVGPAGDDWLLRAARGGDRIVCAWGEHGRHRGRGDTVRRLLIDNGHQLHHLGLTKGHQQPRHPLYLARDTALQVWA
ncbi:hypothetical protein UU9_12558 [Rhodanobacter fulvus Jip2]|uniref:DUF1643 domain-containing protein n=1 Tax=Rhodanobacter fulvus Jip2 TaxID=1163408 RepID=I4VMZ0_9GAMM|nr:DUF1643 domain-containing protein [Rhodanobacter fulvus]EIL88581.1 hypothetical protein UU9_12558 [Rhodanobacter fulvus Jip2]